MKYKYKEIGFGPQEAKENGPKRVLFGVLFFIIIFIAVHIIVL